MNGYGTFYWKDGRVYRGYYKDDKKHDFGIYIGTEGKRYEGFWENGSQRNLGKYQKRDGSIKVGIWNENNLIEQYTNEEDLNRALDLINSKINETEILVEQTMNALKEKFNEYLPNIALENLINS